MTRPRPVRTTRPRRTATAVTALLCVLVGVLTATPAQAYFAPDDNTPGTALVTQLAAPTAVTISSVSTTVTVKWTTPVSPTGGRPDGYYVTRDSGGGPVAACGTVAGSPATYLAGTVVLCTDTAPIGSVTYTVTAVWRTWSTDSLPSNSISVVADGSGPSQTLALAPGATNATLIGNRLYYRPTAAGGFTLRSTLTDSGTGPASTTFPAIGATGWTHAAETVTTGTGSAPTITYSSSPYTWTAGPALPAAQAITGRDVANNPVTTTVPFTADANPPTLGAITVNAVAATGAGSVSYNRTGSFSLAGRVDWTEATSTTESGLASSTLTRASATVTNGVCGSYGAATTLTGTPAQSGLTVGCYRFTLTGTDLVGNTTTVSTTVVVDPTAPTQTFALTAATGAALVGTNLYVRTSVAGSFQVRATVTDAQSGPGSETFPVVTTSGWTHAAETVSTGTGSAPTITYTSSLFSWIAGAGTPGRRSFIGADLAGGTVTTSLRFRADNTGPTGGALTVNGVAASSAGSLSTNATGSWTIARTDYNADGGSGFATSVLTVATAPYTGGVCGTFGATTVIVGAPAQAGPAATCFKYVLTGTDAVGNPSTLTTTVRRA